MGETPMPLFSRRTVDHESRERLEAVGAVLRHRSPDTTAIYAKVDIPMLQKIAQPWPGDLTC